MVEQVGTWLVNFVLPALGGVLLVAGFRLAWKYADRIEDERLREVVRELIRAAEQMFGAHEGSSKLEYVEAKLRQRGLASKVDRAKIEALVHDEFGRFDVAPDTEGELVLSEPMELREADFEGKLMDYDEVKAAMADALREVAAEEIANGADEAEADGEG